VVDLVKRKIVWENPLGTRADSGPYNIRTGLPLPMGVPNSGGTMTTRSGLIFVAATQERAIRAYTVNSGKLVWKARLPAGGHAAPMSYISPKTGRQFVVIAAGGNVSLHSGADDAVVAFALKR
jgi:quinoprotein glucose dehydrogenase